MMIIVYCVQNNYYRPPRWLRRMVLGYMARAVFLYDADIVGTAERGTRDDENKMNFVCHISAATLPESSKECRVQIPQSLLDDVSYLRKKVETTASRDLEMYMWEHGSRVIDRWLLIITMVVWAVTTVTLLVRSKIEESIEG